MRILATFLVCLFTLPLASSGQEAAAQCPQSGSYDLGYANNIGKLRWSLFQLSTAKLSQPEVKDTVVALTDGAVYSLANIHSLRIEYVRSCGKPPHDYPYEMAANERFIALLAAATSTKDFPLPSEESWKNFYIHPVITGRIEQLRKERNARPDHPDALWVAESELLEGKMHWNEADIEPVPLNVRDQELKSLWENSMFDLHPGIAESPWKTLTTLKGYYKTPKK